MTATDPGSPEALAALHEVATEGAVIHAPYSPQRWDAWRARQPHPEQWPSADDLAEHFGTWPDALDAAVLHSARSAAWEAARRDEDVPE
ncbi:MAG: hypothetical protein L0K94_09515 [Acidipropionibacterium jensenii]|nr:hypothetical protein [Acidipropionibacterium jensenii]MDN6658369.1 hypothetical protein [Acidipropionibacterium jensenii]MDN6794570.1 hypothetical protein [Propionibacterium sp.]